MQAFDIGQHELAVDKDGTVWFFHGQWNKWRYLTDEGALSWDSVDDLLEVHEPYVVLDKGAAKIVQFEIDGLLIDEQPKTLLGSILDTVE